MIKVTFYSKNWSDVSNVLFNEYAGYKFLYVNCPQLWNKKAHLLFKYIEDRGKFNEAVQKLIEGDKLLEVRDI